MKLKDVLVKVGSSIFSEMVPGGGAILDIVNEFTGNKVVDNNSTGQQVKTAIEKLDPESQAKIFSRDVDLSIAEIEGWTNVQTVLAEADKAGASTRPYIARMMAWAVFLTVVALAGCFVLAIVDADTGMLDSLGDAWPAIIALLGTPTALLRAYFGLRTSEKKSRYAAASGQSIPSAMSSIASFIKSR